MAGAGAGSACGATAFVGRDRQWSNLHGKRARVSSTICDAVRTTERAGRGAVPDVAREPVGADSECQRRNTRTERDHVAANRLPGDLACAMMRHLAAEHAHITQQLDGGSSGTGGCEQGTKTPETSILAPSGFGSSSSGGINATWRLQRPGILTGGPLRQPAAATRAHRRDVAQAGAPVIDFAKCTVSCVKKRSFAGPGAGAAAPVSGRVGCWAYPWTHAPKTCTRGAGERYSPSLPERKLDGRVGGPRAPGGGATGVAVGQPAPGEKVKKKARPRRPRRRRASDQAPEAGSMRRGGPRAPAS